MKIKFTKDNIIKLSKQIKGMYELVLNAHISLGDNKFVLLGQDSANISMVMIETDCIIEKGYDEDILLKLEDFNKICKTLKEDTTIEIKDNKFFISNNKKSFELPLYVEDEEKQYWKSLPNVESDLVIEITASDLKDALDDAKVINDNEVCFNVVDNILYLSAIDGIRKSNSKLTIINEVATSLINCKFSYEYILKSLGCSQDEKVTLHLKTGVPILITSTDMKFILAPRANEKND